MTYQEINEFLSHFNSNSYNKKQIGNSKNTIYNIYEYLKKLNIPENIVTTIINNIAYLNKDNINLPLYLEILTKSLGYINDYELKEIIQITKEIHNIYYHESKEISLDSYIHETKENRIKKIFLNRNNHYLKKDFTDLENYIDELKFAAALTLDSKCYKEFMGYIDNFETFKDSYSPLINIRTYIKIRKNIKGLSKLFWDIVFGNEYLVAFSKHDLKLNDIYKENFLPTKEEHEFDNEDTLQLDIFNFEEYEESTKFTLPNDFKEFQIATIYNEVSIPNFNTEKDLLAYYNNLLKKKETIILPKLKNKSQTSYIFEIN